jgi:hypothetical protein
MLLTLHPDAPRCQGRVHYVPGVSRAVNEEHECGPDCPRCLECGAGLCESPATLEDNEAEDLLA